MFVKRNSIPIAICIHGHSGATFSVAAAPLLFLSPATSGSAAVFLAEKAAALQRCFLSKFSAATANKLLPRLFQFTFSHVTVQVRSQKFAMGGGLFGGSRDEAPAAGGWGFGGKAPSRRRHGGLGKEPPALKNFAFFCKNNIILGLF